MWSKHVFTLSSDLLLPPIASFSRTWKVKTIYIKSQYEMLRLSIKCRNSSFNAQGSRLIIVVVLLAVKIYVAAVSRSGKRKDKTKFSLPPKIDGFLSFIPCWMLKYFFAGFFFNLTLCMIKLGVLVLRFSYFTHNSNFISVKIQF
jgi:hypothetical protein